jgi:hypothetical protein
VYRTGARAGFCAQHAMRELRWMACYRTNSFSRLTAISAWQVSPMPPLVPYRRPGPNSFERAGK